MPTLKYPLLLGLFLLSGCARHLPADCDFVPTWAETITINDDNIESWRFNAACFDSLHYSNLKITTTATDLSFLSNIVFYDECSILIENCPNLTDLSFFSNAHFFYNALRLINNPKLVSLHGLELISDNDNALWSIHIANNHPDLDLSPIFTSQTNIVDIHIEGINNLQQFPANINYYTTAFIKNCGITDLTFLDQIEDLDRLHLSSNPYLANLNAAKPIKARVLFIENNPMLTSIVNIDTSWVTNISLEYRFEGNEQLSDFCPLKPLCIGLDSTLFQLTISNNLANPTAQDIIDNCQ